MADIMDARSLQLKITDESLSRSESGAIWGRVYFENGDQFFPELDWNDMVVAFLSAWLDALAAIATGSAKRRAVRFMDGPFMVALSAGNDKTADVDLMHRELVGQSAKATIEDLLKNAVLVASSFLCSVSGEVGVTTTFKRLRTR